MEFSHTRDETTNNPQPNDDEIRVTDESNGSIRTQNSFDQAKDSRRSAHHTSTTVHETITPPPDKEHTPRRTRTKYPSIFGLTHQLAGRPGVVTTEDSRTYAPSPPFEEAGATSSVWHAYLHESWNYDTDMVGNQRGEMNILLVFAGLFSAVVSTFIIQSSSNLQQDYQKLSAVLLFDQINIQRALANGTSLDRITTSGADPAAPFTPKHVDSVINGLWIASLTLSLATAFFAILADEWYCYYLSPVPGDPQVRARTRHLRLRGLRDWHVSTLIGLLPLMLHLSLGMFFAGLVLYLQPKQKGIAITVEITSLATFTFYLITSTLPLIFPACPYKTPLTSVLSAIKEILADRKTLELLSYMHPAFRLLFIIHDYVQRHVFKVDLDMKPESLESSEISAAEKSRIENEVVALHWLYERSSTSAVCRLVIRALAGLAPDYIARAEEVFSPRWVEIRDETDRMLMDCMELSRDGTPRWIPKDIPNICGRIEPLLRLEILFPDLRRKFPSTLFGEHNLDFSKKLSNTLSITLSCIDDAHIQKPTEQNQVFMDALADNGVHHPLVWKKLLDRYVDKEKLFHDAGVSFTIEMCLNLVTSIYLPEDSPPTLCNCTLAYASVASHKPEILKGLLSFFESHDLHRDAVDPEQRLSLAIVRTLAPDSALSGCHPHQHYPFHHYSLISKYRLLGIALHAIHKDILHHSVDQQWRTYFSWAILSYMRSDSFTGRSSSHSEYSEFKGPFWTCRAYALVCMALLMDPEDRVIEWKVEWAKKPLFLNILEVIQDERIADALPLPAALFILDERVGHALPPVVRFIQDERVANTFPLSAIRAILPTPQRVDSIIGVVGWLLDQAFRQRIPGAYEAFRETGSLHYIEEKSTLHPELIELLRGYTTGLSDAKVGNLQSVEFFDRHIKDLHQAPVIRCICASIVRSGTPPRPILSTLASIAPHDDKWRNILQTLNSLDDEYRDSVQGYTLYPTDNGTPNDLKRWKKNMKEIVRILAECLKVEKGRNNNVNQTSTSFNHRTVGLETDHESGRRPYPGTDLELGLFPSGNVDAT